MEGVMENKKKVFLLITDGGGGHRAAASAIKNAIESRGYSWEVRIINIFKDMENHQYISRFIERFYQFVLRRGYYKLVKYLIYLSNLTSSSILKFQSFKEEINFIDKEKPELLILMNPFASDVVNFWSSSTRVPFGIVITDLKSRNNMIPWFTKKSSNNAAFMVIPKGFYQDARSFDVPDSKIIKIGYIVHSKFFEDKVRKISKEAAREQLKLEPKLPTILLTAGGYGAFWHEEFVKLAEISHSIWQIIVVCGNNEKLKNNLLNLVGKCKNKIVPIGFSLELHWLLKASDLMITKPGPGTIWESLVMETPIILDTSIVMPQELPNVEFVLENGCGEEVPKRDLMVGRVEELLFSARFNKMKENIRALNIVDDTDKVVDAIKKTTGD